MYLLFVVQLLGHVWLFTTPWNAARQASLSFTITQSLLRLMSIESLMPSNHLILCHSLLLPSIFSSIRVFSSESVLHIRWPNYCSFCLVNNAILIFFLTLNSPYLFLARTLIEKNSKGKYVLARNHEVVKTLYWKDWILEFLSITHGKVRRDL